MTRHLVQLVAGLGCAVGAALSWLQVRSLVDVAPVTEGQPGTVSVVYDPPMMLLSWALATTAGVVLVLGVAGVLRCRREDPGS